MNIYKYPYEKYPILHKQEVRGTEGMEVSLVDYPVNPYHTIALGQTASYRPWKDSFTIDEMLKIIGDISSGKIWAGQCFEGINFVFKIEGISRALTHQLVRVRVGAGMMQESGREGTWEDCSFITPLTILENPQAHKEYVNMMGAQIGTYSYLKEIGIPPQDARFMFGHGVAQNMWLTINMRALMEWCSKRLCTTMQWEINTLARMIRDSVLERFPHLGVMLKSVCEKSGGCVMEKKYRGQESAIYYHVGDPNNGNKVYFPLEGNICGKAGLYSEDNIQQMLDNEIETLEDMPS